MLNDWGTDLGSRLFIAVVAVGIGLIVMVGIMMSLKRRNSSLFVRGGKSRDPRLVIVDAAAVDAKRRLVLIRRDNVEHLVMIGGPTDIVIERGISTESTAATRALQPIITPDAPRPDRAAAIRAPLVQAQKPQAPSPSPGPISGKSDPALIDPRAKLDPRPVSSATQIPESTRETALPADSPTRPSGLSAAQDALEATRLRVLPSQPLRQPQPQPQPQSLPASNPKAIDTPAATKDTPRPDALATEFEQILEAEMVANGISLEDASREKPDHGGAEVRPAAPIIGTQPLPASPDGQADNALEKEMIRLMGEISADRKN